MKAWERWERQVHEERLIGNHLVVVNKDKQWKKTKPKIKSLEQYLLKAITNKWTYVKSSPIPSIELAWIIYSQIGWKSPFQSLNDPYTLEEEELWEDLPETDPLEISLLCREILNKEIINEEDTVESLIPTETLFCLKNVLDELASHGIDIREESFSKNWIRNKKRHRSGKNSGRIQEILAKEKDALFKLKEEYQKSGLLIKKTTDKKKQKGKKPQKKGPSKGPSRILASFFGLA